MWIIYEYKFIPTLEAPKGFVPWKATPELLVVAIGIVVDMLPSKIKAYIYGCFD